ncbi:hypothetical protein BZJ17_15030 [Salinivibrio sp. IB574]|nr:hypothetical protein BZJ17_15030 [Salinivibrio sp. IB574]
MNSFHCIDVIELGISPFLLISFIENIKLLRKHKFYILLHFNNKQPKNRRLFTWTVITDRDIYQQVNQSKRVSVLPKDLDSLTN